MKEENEKGLKQKEEREKKRAIRKEESIYKQSWKHCSMFHYFSIFGQKDT
jgi:hypothetical protein